MWVNGTPASGGLVGRLAVARSSVVGAGHAPVLVVLSLDRTRPGSKEEVDGLMRGFLQSQPTLSPQVTVMSAKLAKAAGE
jgi:hypothetical protein